jgi:hypothetical protein
MEPYRLRRWKPRSATDRVQFFTCARPGRSQGKSVHKISDDLVHRWVRGLPGLPNTVIVSLLGRKQNSSGLSEFSFYSFYGSRDSESERRGRLSFQQWLDRWHKDKHILVIEHPTYDCSPEPIPEEIKNAVAIDINTHLLAGRTVVLVDSGGETRTRTICTYMDFIEDSSLACRSRYMQDLSSETPVLTGIT